jgi:dTDP-4-dehydrorhamnose reductase
VYHYAGRGTTSWAGFAREIFAQATGKLVRRVPEIVPIAASDYPAPAPRPANSALDCTAFERDFGIEMVDWRSALSRVIGQIAQKRPMA